MLFPLVQIFCFRNRKSEPLPGMIPVGAALRQETENVELRRAFEKEHSELHNIRTAGDYQQITAANHVAHLSVIEMVISFWRSGASWEKFLGHTSSKSHGKIAIHHPWLEN